jgi:hypothetical protein
MKIHRCGWCGHPTDQDGDPIQLDPGAYLRAHADVDEVLVDGACCPGGDQQGAPEHTRIQVTREMAIDAGDRSLEGMWIDW